MLLRSRDLYRAEEHTVHGMRDAMLYCYRNIWTRSILVFSTGCILALFGQGACSKKSDKIPNVLLISIDTLRADHLGYNGYYRDTSPFLDGLARTGVSFQEAISSSPWTLPSHTSLLTGLYPKNHGVKDENTHIPPGIILLAEYFRANGFSTEGIVNSVYLSERYGFGKGFDNFRYIPENYGAEFVIEAALSYLQTKKKNRFFLFLHFYDLHSDYSPGPDYKNLFNVNKGGRVPATTAALQGFRKGQIKITSSDMEYIVGLYDAEIRELSDKLEIFFNKLKTLNVLENTLVIITSDHGEEFLDHGGVLHGRTLYDELIRVPLIFWGPGIPAGTTVREQVELIDIMPTLLELNGFSLKTELDGQSFAGLLNGRGESRNIRAAFAEADHNNTENDIKRMIRADGYKLYFDRLTGIRKMYHLVSDPLEKKNLYNPENGTAIDLDKRLFEWMGKKETRGTEISLSEKEIEHLKSLGYVN